MTVHHNRLKPCRSDPEKPRAAAPAPPRLMAGGTAALPTRAVRQPSGLDGDTPRLTQSAVGSPLGRLPAESREGGTEAGKGPARRGQVTVVSPLGRSPAEAGGSIQTEEGDTCLESPGQSPQPQLPDRQPGDEPDSTDGEGTDEPEQVYVTHSRSGRTIRQPVHLRDYVTMT